MSRTVQSVCVAVAVGVLSPASVRADTVMINSGSVTLGSLRGQAALVGTLVGEGFWASFRWSGPTLPCPSGCLAGELITLTSTLHAPHVINSFGFPNVAEGATSAVAYAGDLTFSGPAFLLPPVPPSSDPLGFPLLVQLSGPFTLTGILSEYSLIGQREPRLLYTTSLFGTGTVTAEFFAGPGQRYSLTPDFPRNQLRYDFAPVPEPGTLLLIGGGLAATWVARRRERTIRPRR